MQQAPVGKEPRVAGRDGPYPVLRAPAMPPQAFVFPFRPTGQPSVKVLKGVGALIQRGGRAVAGMCLGAQLH